MSATTLAVALAAALGAMAVVLNHCYARLALVELTLNEGLPPGYATVGHQAKPSESVADPAALLPAGVHVFLSRTCHACQRLIDELDQVDLDIAAPLTLHYVDRARPVATSAALRHKAELHEHEVDLAQALGADPLPMTIAIGPHALTVRAATPTVDQLLVTSRDAGIAATRSAVESSSP